MVWFRIFLQTNVACAPSRLVRPTRTSLGATPTHTTHFWLVVVGLPPTRHHQHQQPTIPSTRTSWTVSYNITITGTTTMILRRLSLILLLSSTTSVLAFAPRMVPSIAAGSRHRRSIVPVQTNHIKQQQPSSTTTTSSPTQLHMFMGSDGGLLGVGGPELVSRMFVLSCLDCLC